MKAFIKAVSYYLPRNTFSSSAFFELFPEAQGHRENLLKVGVRNRHIASDQTALDLGAEAAEQLFKEHGIAASDIGMLIFCAQEDDFPGFPSAAVLHDILGLPEDCGAFDYNMSCTGYIYGLSLAKGFAESAGIRNILLINSSVLSKKLHPGDKSSRFIFGDGASATLISSREDEEGIGTFVFGTDGKEKEKIMIRDGGARFPLSESSFTEVTDEYGNTTSPSCLYMNGSAVFLFGLKRVPAMISELLRKAGKKLEDIDLFIFHQANLFLLDAIAKKAGIPSDRLFNFMEDTGNTVSASIPIALAEAIRQKKAKKGDRILLAGFGVGLSWAATIIRL